jgi:type IV secretory pathway VirB10-like protein
MKRCPTCGEHYADKEKFCEQDGTPLGPPQTVAAQQNAGASSPWLIGVAGLFVGVSVCALALVFYFSSTQDERDKPQSNQRAETRKEAETPYQSVVSAPPTPESADTTPTPVESPTPPSPTPSPTPASPPVSPLRMLRDAPASTDGQSGNRVVIGLDDGTDIVADDAWRMQDGVWYRRGSLVTFLDPSRIRSIERRQQREPEP